MMSFLVSPMVLSCDRFLLSLWSFKALNEYLSEYDIDIKYLKQLMIQQKEKYGIGIKENNKYLKLLDE